MPWNTVSTDSDKILLGAKLLPNADLFSIWNFGTQLREIWIEMHKLSIKKLHTKKSYENVSHLVQILQRLSVINKSI